MLKVNLLEPSSPTWSDLLSKTEHDFYHLPSYVELCARRDGGRPAAIHVVADDDGGKREMLLPAIVRSIADGAWDVAAPYGYPGALVLGGADADADAVATEAIGAACKWLRGEGCVSLFARLHPILGATPRPENTNALLVQHGETVHVDLRKSEEALWSQTMSGHRNEINRAMRAGHTAFFDERFERVERFVEIYQSTMSRVSAGQYYFFDRDYVLGLRAALGARLKLAFVDIGGREAAAGLFIETGKMIQYHLSGTDDAFVRERPTKLMLHFVRRWAKERGARWMHLGGGVGGLEDSLFKFKAGFSKERAPFYTLRMIVDPDRYQALSIAKHPATENPLALDGFFPLYRKP